MKKFILNITISFIVLFGLSIIALNLIGFKTYRVISDSMSPKIYKNALAIVRTYNDDVTMEENDIIAFSVNGKLVLHRIVEINDVDKQIITKGDANDVVDPPISYNDVVGVYVFSIPLIGILFASIYPWIVVILLVVCYIIIKQILEEFKKNGGGK